MPGRIDSPNQISPIMENAITPADLFVVPFESTKAVKSYANVYALVRRIRGAEPLALHVLSNLSRLQGFGFDYNSSGKSDHLALYRPGKGIFWILRRQ